ncbi:MobF family relaxase [Nocardia wallacei]|uniref:TrwC relaxase domain-containing protein n=1 Tax=Nocardia wallacei TaxID=480035 RepID=A0A7G1KG26_9NOCA|nr:MobF family relaxase [Nocardia wallacei]BCK53193.1 hypothetical protein NWFMUON74_09650 [Nocardia wallacei]
MFNTISTATTSVFERCMDPSAEGTFRGLLAKERGLAHREVSPWAALEGFRQTPTGTVAAYELVFSPPRSWSIVWGLADRDTDGANLDRAHAAAVTATMEYVEHEYTYTRRGVNGVRQIDTTGLLWAQFEHFADGLGRPDRHTHAMIGARVVGSDGEWGPLDPRPLLQVEEAGLFDAYYRGRLVGFSREFVGMRFEEREPNHPGDESRLEVVGVPDELIASFFA